MMRTSNRHLGAAAAMLAVVLLSVQSAAVAQAPAPAVSPARGKITILDWPALEEKAKGIYAPLEE